MRKLKKFAIGIVSIFILIISWALIEPYYVDVEEEEVVLENLPSSWENKKIAVMGDFQLGMWMDNTKTIEWMVEDTLEIKPDVILLTGDFIYHAAKDKQGETDRIKNLLQPLMDEDIPVYGVLGNHDYALASEKAEPDEDLANTLVRDLESIGINMLQNEALALPGPTEENEGEPLYLAGIGSKWADKDDPAEALKDIPESAARLVLMHNPDSFNTIQANSAPLSVAGHTHGGQIRIPFTQNWSYIALAQKGEVHADGWIDNYGEEGNNLYVNRGVGFSILPMRFLCPPELTVFTLKGTK